MRKAQLGPWSVVFASLLVAPGCSHSKVNQDIDSKLKNEPDFTKREEVSESARETIEDATNLTAPQKQSLLALHQRVRTEASELRHESLKLRALLVSELISPTYREDEVRQIKKRIENLDHRQLSLVFKAVDDADKILGHHLPENERVMRLFDEAPHGHVN